MTKDEAITLFNSGWWNGLSAREVAQRQLYEERLIMPFDKFHEVMNEALGRPVWTHEFAGAERLIAEFEGRAEPPAGPIESLAAVMSALPGK